MLGEKPESAAVDNNGKDCGRLTGSENADLDVKFPFLIFRNSPGLVTRTSLASHD